MWWNAYKKAKPELKSRAFREVFTVGFVSLSPLLFGILVEISKGEPAGIYGLWPTIAKFIFSGQLFFFAMSFAGSIMYYSANDWHRGNFPPRLWFFLTAFLCSAASFSFIGLDPTLSTRESAVVFVVSVLIYGVTCYAYFVLLVMTSIDPPTAEQANNQSVDALADELRALRETMQ